MLTIRKLKKSYGGRILFEGADLQINYGERVALVGPNGAGKSTIFRIILGDEEADKGTVERDEWTLTGFLPQESEDVGDYTVLEIATGRAGMLQTLETTLKSLDTSQLTRIFCPLPISHVQYLAHCSLPIIHVQYLANYSNPLLARLR